MRNTILLTAILLSLAAAAIANVPRPTESPKKGKQPAGIDTYLSIRLDRNATEAKLIVPRAQLKQLIAELDGGDPGTGDTAAAGITGIQTIMAGVFFSLAIAVGGIWFARSGRMTAAARYASVAAMTIFSCGALATVIYGNAGPPSEARSITGKMFSPAMHVYKFGGGKIKLEISDAGDQIKLIVPDVEKPTEKAEE